MNSQEFPSRMKGIHQIEPTQDIPLCRIRSSECEKEHLAREIL